MILVNGEVIEFKDFPNGETKVPGSTIFTKTTSKAENWVGLKYEDDRDLVKMMFVKRYLDNFKLPTSLKIYYMPYSRMDRTEGMGAFTLKDVADFINSLNFNRVFVYEPHSDVTPALLNNCSASYPTIDFLPFVKNMVSFDEANDFLFFPDAGAQKRYGKSSSKHLVGFKSRNFQSGRIDSLEIVGTKVEKFNVIIMDDLCSYGGTFMLSAKELKKVGADKIYLLVTHCENTIFKGEVLNSDLVDKVFTTDTIIHTSTHPKIHIFEV